MTRAADVTCRPVDWLWRDRVPRGMLTLLAGDPKLGKSLVTLATAAAVSRARCCPATNRRVRPGASSSSAPKTTRPGRSNPAGSERRPEPRPALSPAADPRRHQVMRPNLTFAKDIDVIEEAVAALADCRLVVFDPISAYLGGTDDHKNGELRGVLSPLKLMAERTDTAVVLVTHLSKCPGRTGSTA